jgi:molybdopterin biosynthesis enzyme
MSADVATELGVGGDPRMKGFRSRASVAELSAWIAGRMNALSSENVLFRESCVRVLAKDVVATEAVPAFDRSAMSDEFHFRPSINHDQSIRSAHQIPAG